MLARLNELTLPKSGQLKDGAWVSNYNSLPVKILEAEGWLPLEEVKPSYDALTQMLELESTAEVDGKIVVTYKAILDKSKLVAKAKDNYVKNKDKLTKAELISIIEILISNSNNGPTRVLIA